MKFHHVGMVVRSVSVAEKLCRERLKDNEPLVWGPVPAFQCAVAFSTRFPMIEFVVPEPESRLVKFLGASPSSTTSRLPSRTSGILCLFRRVTSYSMSQRLSPSRGFWSTFSNPLRGSWSRWYRRQRARVDCVLGVGNSVLASAGDF